MTWFQSCCPSITARPPLMRRSEAFARRPMAISRSSSSMMGPTTKRSISCHATPPLISVFVCSGNRRAESPPRGTPASPKPGERCSPSLTQTISGRSEKIAKQVVALQAAGPQYALVYTWYALIDKDSRIIDRSYRPFESGDVLARLCYGNLVGNGSSALIRKAALLEAGGFDSSLRARSAQGCEDLQLCFRLAEQHLFALVPEYLTGYRRTPTNMSSDLLQMYRSWMLVTEDAKARQPRLAAAIETGRSTFIRGLIERAIASRQPGPAIFLASRLLRRDPAGLASMVFSRACGVISRRWRHSFRSRVPAPERFAVGDPAMPSPSQDEKNRPR